MCFLENVERELRLSVCLLVGVTTRVIMGIRCVRSPWQSDGTGLNTFDDPAL